MTAAPPKKLPPGIRRRSFKTGSVYEIYFMANGEQVFERVGTDLRQAVQRRKERLREVAAGTYQRGAAVGGLTANEWFKLHYDKKERAGQVTVKDARARFKNWIAPVIGALPMRSMESSDLEGVVRKLDAAVRERADWFEEHGDEKPESGRLPGISWKTAWNVWGEVTDAFREACTSKLPELRVRVDNPATNVQGPDRGDDREKPILYPSEFLALVSCEQVPLYRRRAYAVAVYLAARANELAALGPEDVDTVHRRVRINKQRDRKTRNMRPTKTKRQRLVEIEAELAPLLDILVASKRERLVHLPPDEDRAELLRADLVKAGVTRDELSRDDALHAPIKFHDLRATGLTWMGARGDAPLAIQWRGGHTDFKTTQGYIEQGQKLAAGFGTPFPPLPEALYDVDYDGLPAALASGEGYSGIRRPQRELNPCYRRERPVS